MLPSTPSCGNARRTLYWSWGVARGRSSLPRPREFVDAQAKTYAVVIDELTKNVKRSLQVIDDDDCSPPGKTRTKPRSA